MVRSFFLFVAVGFGVTFAQIPGQSQISASTIGILGKPFGSKIEISGIANSHPMAVFNSITISVIDGKLLSKTVDIEVRNDWKIEKGFLYTFVGYESGSFEGEPAWAANAPTDAQVGLHFYSSFVPVRLVQKVPIAASGASAH
jgi:hypothetical protein